MLGSSRAPFVSQPRRDGELRTAFRKALGAYLMGMAVFVAVWFVVNPFFDVSGVWDVANYLMAVALVAALAFNVRRKYEDSAGQPAPAGRQLG